MPQSRPSPPPASSSASNINPALSGQNDAAAAAHQSLSNLQLGHMDSAQILALLRHLPGVFNKLTEGTLKDGTAAQLQQHIANSAPGGPDGPPPLNDPHESPYADDPNDADYINDPSAMQNSPTQTTRRRRPDTGTDEWIRQRKDNHKEVERRRRGNINEGINELSRIIPTGAGEKAKGAILTRAVQYIHSLKENEARNIEKWTLEKLLMDQAMGDLQAQLEEMRKMWEEERAARESADAQLATLRADIHRLQAAEEAHAKAAIAASGGDAPDREEENGEGSARKRARID